MTGNKSKQKSTNKTTKQNHRESHWYNTRSLYISFGALIISICSLFFTWNEYKLAEKQDYEKRFATWVGTYNKEKQELAIKSSTEDITLQLANVYFPSEIDSYEWNISPPNYTLSTYVLENAIARYLDTHYERNDNIQVITSDFPIVIYSNYIAFGLTQSIKSQYYVRFIATLSDKEFKQPTVEIQGIWLNTHLTSDVDPIKYLDDLWKEGLIKQEPPSIY